MGRGLAVALAVEVLQVSKPVNGQAMRIMLAFHKDFPKMLRQAIPRAL